MLRHDSDWVERFNLLVLCAVFMNLVAVPFRIAFLPSPLSYIPDYLFDVVLVSDMWLKMNRISVIVDGEHVMDPIKVSKKKLMGGRLQER